MLIRAARRPGYNAKLAALAPAETRSRVARDHDHPGHVSHDHRVGRAPTPVARPYIPRPPPALEATPRDLMPGGQPPRPRGEAARGHVACDRHHDRAGHSRTHARRFGTATIHAGFGWIARFACFETPPAGAALLGVIRVLPRPPVRDPETHSRGRAPHVAIYRLFRFINPGPPHRGLAAPQNNASYFQFLTGSTTPNSILPLAVRCQNSGRFGRVI